MYNGNVQKKNLKGFWIEVVIKLSTFTLHDYKANRANYFRKFRNVKVKQYFFFSPKRDVIGYSIL
jgi:hypothetical protein